MKDSTLLHHIVLLLNRALDKGLINTMDFQRVSSTTTYCKELKAFALHNGLLRSHNVKIVSPNSQGAKKSRKTYTITRHGILFLLKYDVFYRVRK